MAINRRDLFKALFAAPLAKLGWPRNSNIGQRPDLIDRFTERPCPLPRDYRPSQIENFTLSAMIGMYNGCSFGNEHPRVISVSPQTWRAFWSSIEPCYRSLVADSDLARRGYKTIQFQDAEMVEDGLVEDHDVWFINPNKLDQFGWNGRLTFRSEYNELRPQPKRADSGVSDSDDDNEWAYSDEYEN